VPGRLRECTCSFLFCPLRRADSLSSLLDVLAQRKDFGEIRGSILIDGKPQGVSFQRMTGYCEQMDVHEGTATVKEALVFSALLRQPRDVPEAEKLAYVEHIIDLLELRDICDALIGGMCMIPISR
jgi:ABC-type multidrug transport system ATPase subunit